MTKGSKQDKSQWEETARKLPQNGAVEQLLRSQDTKRMMQMLGSRGDVKGAAKAAATGDTTKLMGMMQQLLNDPEGAKLVEKIKEQAERSGL